MAVINLAQWPRMSQLLDELLEVDHSRRAEHLAEIGGHDPEIAAQLARLLARQSEVETTQFLEGTALTPADHLSLAGRVVGNYTLESLLGSGGMGGVWLARRSDGRYEGRAAVKFLNLALLGRTGEERFRREGVALARLSHPNIAQLIDAGTDRGQPYLVLEYVEGQPIDEWCDAHSLTVKERIRLFREVLAAVVHAHERLILHRDLKPSNILVTREGRIKLLDFGVAKLLDDPQPAALAGGNAQQTARVFTPDYAAPEQVRGGEVTTATDVYTLGVLLHALLVGQHPTARDVSPLERMRAVIESEPSRMSEAALRGSMHAAALRSATPARLARELRGDLDNIVAKALKKSPAERYHTAAAFGDDLRRYVKHEPVEARADSAAYRVGRFIRRNRTVVAAVGMGILLSIAGVVGIAWQALEARRERDEAVLQAEQARARDNLFSLLLGATADGDRPLTQREILERGAKLADRYRNNPSIATGLLRLVRGEYYTLGDLEKSGEIERRIIDIAEASGDPELVADASCNAVIGERRRGRIDLATERLRVGLQAQRRIAKPSLGTIGTCARAEADMAFVTGNVDHAIERLSEALRLAENSGPADRATYPSLQGLYPSLLSWLKSMHWLRGDLPASLATIRRAQDYYRSIGQAGSVNYLMSRRAEAELMMAWGEYRDARTIIDEIAGHWQSAGDKGPSTSPAWLGQTTGQLLHRMGALDAAQGVLSSAAKRSRTEGNLDTALRTEYLLVQVRADLGQREQAENLLAAVESEMRPGVGPDVWWCTPATVRSAMMLTRGRADDAVRLIDAELRRLGHPHAKPSLALGAALRIAARIYTAAGDSRSLDAARSAVTVSEKMARDASRSADVGESLLLLAQAQRQAGDPAGAMSTARRAVDSLVGGLSPDHALTRQARSIARDGA